MISEQNATTNSPIQKTRATVEGETKTTTERKMVRLYFEKFEDKKGHFQNRYNFVLDEIRVKNFENFG